MSNLFKATQNATKVTKAIPAIVKQAFATSSPGPRWPSSMDDLPIRTSYGAKVISQNLSASTGLPSKAGTYDLSIERMHPGCDPREVRKGTGKEEKM